MRIFARLDFSQSGDGEVLTIFWVETKILISHRNIRESTLEKFLGYVGTLNIYVTLEA